MFLTIIHPFILLDQILVRILLNLKNFRIFEILIIISLILKTEVVGQYFNYLSLIRIVLAFLLFIIFQLSFNSLPI